MSELQKRIRVAIDAEGLNHLTDNQRQCLVDGVMSELAPELGELAALRRKLRDANRERGRVSTRLYLARLELREAQQRIRLASRASSSGVEHQTRLLRLLRDLMHAVDPGMVDGPLMEDLGRCIGLAQAHRHALAALRSDVPEQLEPAVERSTATHSP